MHGKLETVEASTSCREHHVEKIMCFPNKSIFPVPVKCHRMLRVVVTFPPTNSKKEVLKPTNTFNINVFIFKTTILDINPPSKEMIAVCSNTSGDSYITQ